MPKSSSKANSKHKSRKRRKMSKLPKVPGKIHSGFVVLVMFVMFVIVYLGGSFYKYLTKPTIPTTVVKFDGIDIPQIFNGVIIRDEVIYQSDSTGLLDFSVADMQRVKKGAVVAAIRNQEDISQAEAGLEAINNQLLEIQNKRSELSEFSPSVERINNQTKNLVDKAIYNYINTNTAEIYHLHDSVEKNINIRNGMLLTENKGTVRDYMDTKNQYETQIKNNIREVQVMQSGIVSYEIDGMEGVFTFDSRYELEVEQTRMSPTKEQFMANRLVEPGQSLFKMVCSNDWYIAAYIPNDSLDNVRENEMKNIYMETEDGEFDILEVYVDKINKGEKDSYVVFKATKRMQDYLGLRNINFKLESGAYRGLKIPNSAIVDRTYLKIPLDYISPNNTVLKKTADKTDIVNVYSTDEEWGKQEGYRYIMLDLNRIKLGDCLIDPKDSAREFIIEETVSAKGVYWVNQGIAEFYKISAEITATSGGYSVIDPSKNPGLSSYDKIVINAEGVVDNQKIN